MTILYCRKSTESEDRQVLSIESQTKELKDLAYKNGLKIDKIITESMSAKAPGRPGFEELIKLAESKKPVIVLSWKMDRLSRNPMDSGKLAWLLQQNIIKEIKTFERSYFPEDNAVILALESAMANQYIRELSTNVKRGNKTKLENGGWPGRAPFGYLNDKANHTIVPDPINAPYVVEIFEMFASGGHSLKQIVTHINSHPLTRRVHTSLIYRTITNPFYTGLMLRNGKLYQGAHTPLINKTIFDACQAILNPNRERTQKHLFPLRGYMSCAKCGCALTATTKKGKFKYYYCTNGKKICDQHRNYIKAEDLNTQVADQLKALEFDEELIEIMYQAAKETNHAQDDYKLTVLDQIQSKLTSLTIKQDKLLNLFLADSLSEEAYNLKNKVLKQEQISLQNQHRQLLQEKNKGQSTLELIKKAFLSANYARKDFLNADDIRKRKLVENLLWNFQVVDKKIVNFRLKQPFQIIADKEKTPSFDDILSWQGR